MSLRQLEQLLNPRSIAVIGASTNPKRPGYIVMRNLLMGGFDGPIMPVNRHYRAVCGVLAYADIDALPQPPELAIICTAARRVPGILQRLADKGTRYVIVVAGGFGPAEAAKGLKADVVSLLRTHQMRLIGPNSLGIINPAQGLNASLAHTFPKTGRIGFVSQSAAVCTTILDWADSKGIGFSHFISIGDALNLGVDELLDFLGRDSHTRAILLYLDTVTDGRRFMSAARAAARNKPVLVIKSGRTGEGARAAQVHSGGIVGMDCVYDAAFRRAGMLRVNDFHELFAALETLAHGPQLSGERLAIVTNGGGPGVIAADALLQRGGRLAELDDATLIRLNQVLPPMWSQGNPVDLVGDADGQRYADALAILLEAGTSDPILLMHAPSAFDAAVQVAERVIEVISAHKGYGKPSVLTNWMGEQAAYEARARFAEAGIPTFRTPEGAVRAFMHMVQYRRNQQMLAETPPSIPAYLVRNSNKAQALLTEAQHQQEEWLPPTRTFEFLACYGLASVPSRLATDAETAAAAAAELGFPVALKISSREIRYKSDVSGVMLGLTSSGEVAQALSEMAARVRTHFPSAQIDGWQVQRMAERTGAHEIRIAVKPDPVFGPVIFIGEGAGSRELEQEAAVALPPLNLNLAKMLVQEALSQRKLKDRQVPLALDQRALALLLVQVSQMVVDCPSLLELDLNPVLLTGDEVMVLDASLRIDNPLQARPRPLAIRPYPMELEQHLATASGRPLLIRPILPEDEQRQKEFIERLTPDDRYKRFFAQVNSLPPEELARLNQIDYDREMAFVAVAKDAQGKLEQLAVVRALADPDNLEAEFAVAVRSDMKGQGLGGMMMRRIIDYCRSRHTGRLVGMTMPQNRGMIGLARKLGFQVEFMMEDGVVEMTLPLNEPDRSSIP